MNNEETHLEKVKEALSFLARELNSRKINWLLGASGALMVHGVEIVPFDLDIFTDKESVEKLASIFSKDTTDSIRGYLENGKTYLKFKMKINGVKVEIFELKMSEVHPVFIDFCGQKIPVNPLKKELDFYQKRQGKEKVVELIKNRLAVIS